MKTPAFGRSLVGFGPFRAVRRRKRNLPLQNERETATGGLSHKTNTCRRGMEAVREQKPIGKQIAESQPILGANAETGEATHSSETAACARLCTTPSGLSPKITGKRASTAQERAGETANTAGFWERNQGCLPMYAIGARRPCAAWRRSRQS